MNILYITNHLNIGGITSYVLSLANELKKRGHQIYVASSAGKLASRFIEEGIVYIPIPIKTKQEVSPGIIFSLFKLLGMIKKYQIDIVHSHSRTTQVLGCLLSKFTAVQYISTCHGFFKKRFSRRIFPCWGRKVIAISVAVKEHLIKDFGVEEEDIRVVHHGIDVSQRKEQSEKRKTEIRKNLGLGDGPVVGIVARLSDVKGHIYLIEAMKGILEKIPTAQLLIVGEGKMKKELVKLVESLGITQSVIFSPEVDDTREVLSAMDLFVMPSLKEGLGLSLMEAMANGIAVIGSDIGGIRSLIQHNLNGLLVQPADSRALKEAILRLLQDAPRREVLGKNGQEFMAQNFSLEKMAEETERVYLECLKKDY